MRKALFLDRDGVINVDRKYVFRKEDFEFIDEIFKICKRYQDEGYLIFVITNQAGIARRIYSEKDFLALTEWMKGKFLEKGIEIAQVYYCPHHPDFSGPCGCRKPEPGMILQAARDYDLDLQNSIVIGDKDTDLMAAGNAGIKNFFFIQDLLFQGDQEIS